MSDRSQQDPLEEIFESQITECCAWIERLTRDREALVQRYMAIVLEGRLRQPDVNVLEAFERFNSGDEDELNKLLNEVGMSWAQLRASAFGQCLDPLRKLEDLIHRQHQNIRHIQKTIDHVKLRPSLVRRLELQVEHAEQMLSDKRVTVHHVESSTKTSKSG